MLKYPEVSVINFKTMTLYCRYQICKTAYDFEKLTKILKLGSTS